MSLEFRSMFSNNGFTEQAVDQSAPAPLKTDHPTISPLPNISSCDLMSIGLGLLVGFAGSYAVLKQQQHPVKAVKNNNFKKRKSERLSSTVQDYGHAQPFSTPINTVSKPRRRRAGRLVQFIASDTPSSAQQPLPSNPNVTPAP